MGAQQPLATAQVTIDGKKKSKCINGNLVPLKALLFLFYGGIGTVTTWLNHGFLSARFSEKESLLIYGLACLFSLVTPFLFGLLSDKTAHPKKVFGFCLLLTGLVYPLVLLVPPTAPYAYQERLAWCLGRGGNDTSCLPQKINCNSSRSELISSIGCSERCNAKLTITKCRYECSDFPEESSEEPPPDPLDDNYLSVENPVEVQAERKRQYKNERAISRIFSRDSIPHLCVRNGHGRYNPLCYVFDDQMHEITVEAPGIAGYTAEDGMCHYPLVGYSGRNEEPEDLLYCSASPLSPNCQVVSCDLHWDGSSSEWSCYDDYVEYWLAFGSFVALHSLGTMLLISSASLLNSATVCLGHEHGGNLGNQVTYGLLGYFLITPLAAFVFREIESLEIPWGLDYVGGWGLWLVLSGFLSLCLPYHAEWVPKKGSIRPMLLRWTMRGHSLIFFSLLVILGFLQGLLDVLGYFQIKSSNASLIEIGLGASAAVAPALLFMFRVEKVIEFCGYQNLFAIALVVLSLQFTGYAYLYGEEVYWSYLLKAMDSFSISVVWVTASFTTYNSAPRSLVATCQSVIVTLYCCLGRGLGGIVGFLGLTFFSKGNFMKATSICSVIFCVFYLLLHHCCLKPSHFTRQKDHDRPGSVGPSGKYTPLRLINGGAGKEEEEDDEGSVDNFPKTSSLDDL